MFTFKVNKAQNELYDPVKMSKADLITNKTLINQIGRHFESSEMKIVSCWFMVLTLLPFHDATGPSILPQTSNTPSAQTHCLSPLRANQLIRVLMLEHQPWYQMQPRALLRMWQRRMHELSHPTHVLVYRPRTSTDRMELKRRLKLHLGMTDSEALKFMAFADRVSSQDEFVQLELTQEASRWIEQLPVCSAELLKDMRPDLTVPETAKCLKSWSGPLFGLIWVHVGHSFLLLLPSLMVFFGLFKCSTLEGRLNLNTACFFTFVAFLVLQTPSNCQGLPIFCPARHVLAPMVYSGVMAAMQTLRSAPCRADEECAPEPARRSLCFY